MISLRAVDPSQSSVLSKKQVEATSGPERKGSLYTLHYADDVMVLQNKQIKEEVCVIDRKSLEVSFKDPTVVLKAEGLKKFDVYAIWGRIEIKGIEFLIIVSKATEVARVGESQIFRAISIKFVTMNIDKFKNFEFEQCWEQLKRTKSILKTGFYFSYNYMLTQRFQGRTTFSLKEMTSSVSEDIFVWNYKATKQLLNGVKDKFHFFVPMIQGFVGSCKIDSTNYLLISRRSYLMGGTRFNSRGIDNLGHVANFVETEQLIESKNEWFSFAQIRGSLPFYWEQFKGIKVNVKVHQTEQINREVLMKHFSFLAENDYKKVVLFNLLSSKRSEEEGLTRYLLGLLDSAQAKGLKGVNYEYLDFHAMVKETDFSPINKDIARIIDQYGVGYSEWETDLIEGKLSQKKKQQAVVRTNCLDCLDRTNAAQTQLAFSSLATALTRPGPPLIPQLSPEILNGFEKGDHPTFKALRTIWADNGDMISTIYAGTGATTSSVTRNGDKSNLGSIFDHGLKTISRFYLNNFDDDYKQEMIDNLLAKQNTTVRLSKTEFDISKAVSAQLSVISLTSVKNNSNIPVQRNFATEIFKELGESAIVIFVAFIHTDKPLVVDGDDHLVFPTFAQLFKAFKDECGGFGLMREFIGARFECLVFMRPNLPFDLSFFKAETVKNSILSKPFGCRLSLIFNQIAIELFAVKVDSGFFSGSPTQAIKGLLDSYIDRQFDYIFFVGPMEQGIEMDNIHKNYFLCVDQDIKNPGDPERANRMYMLVSTNMAERTTSLPLIYDSLDLKGVLTVNSNSFVMH